MYELQIDNILIPVLGIVAGMIIPIAAFIMVYYESKHKKQTIMEIAKHLDNPLKINELVGILDERKKQSRNKNLDESKNLNKNKN